MTGSAHSLFLLIRSQLLLKVFGPQAMQYGPLEKANHPIFNFHVNSDL